jgi:hypothetical protein
LDRVLLALTQVMPPAVRELIGQRPLVTPPPEPEMPEMEYTGPKDETLPEPPVEELPDGVIAAHDPNDPRFPLTDITPPPRQPNLRAVDSTTFSDLDLGASPPQPTKPAQPAKPLPPRSPNAPAPAFPDAMTKVS